MIPRPNLAQCQPFRATSHPCVYKLSLAIRVELRKATETILPLKAKILTFV